MVINKDELITENSELLDNNITYTNDSEKEDELNNQIIKPEDDLSCNNDCLEDANKTCLDNNTNNFENISEPNQESFELDKKETVETNCLALTVRKDYNLSIFKNTILTTFRFSWKIAFSTLVLNVLKLFL